MSGIGPGERDRNQIANLRLPRLRPLVYIPMRLIDVEDRRRYHPDRRFRRLRQVNAVVGGNVIVGRSNRSNVVPSGLRFENPRKLIVCVRRNRRREILHALGRTGRGSRFNKRRRRNELSSISCK